MYRALRPALLALALAASGRSAEAPACPQGADAIIGRKVRVDLESGASASGRLLRVSPESIVLRKDGEERTIEAAAIARIETRSGGKTARNLLIATGAGALAGVLFGAAYDEADSDSLAILFGLIGAGGGAGVGAALPARTTICD